MSSLGKAVKDILAAVQGWDDGEELEGRDEMLT